MQLIDFSKKSQQVTSVAMTVVPSLLKCLSSFGWERWQSPSTQSYWVAQCELSNYKSQQHSANFNDLLVLFIQILFSECLRTGLLSATTVNRPRPLPALVTRTTNHFALCHPVLVLHDRLRLGCLG